MQKSHKRKHLISLHVGRKQNSKTAFFLQSAIKNYSSYSPEFPKSKLMENNYSMFALKKTTVKQHGYEKDIVRWTRNVISALYETLLLLNRENKE